ncbi:MAG TPA: RHS repeat-associated core domain-containing protein, partial [Flavobacteriales bacterium]|nr:RHS repeat-associated core domain-containing protein [Flavobacteriales bacterium]
EETYVTNNGTVDPDRHYNTLHVMDGRSRIATIRVGTDVEDPTPTVKFNLEDHLGTSSVTVASNAMLINREEYYPFGDTCFGAFAKKRYRYVGKEKDNETGLYYYGARYYAAWTCRFVSVDPLADKYMYLTPYNYAANDPIGDFDIDGQQNNKSAQDGGGDQMNFSDMLPKGNDTDSSKPPVVLQMEKKANGGFATGKELEAPDTVGGVNGLIDHAVKKLDQGIGAVKDVADRAKKATFKAAATATVDKLDAMSNGEWSAPASDDDVNAYQLAYQWVHGTGPVERTFNENSTMGQGMLRTEYVEKAMFLSAKNAFDGKFRSQQARRSLGKLSLIGSSLYAFDFFRDVTVGNEVRGFQGSIGGSVQAGGPINLLDNFTIQVPLTIQLTDSMSARSGSRASGQAGGYDIENPTAVYKENNPYGPNGPFRTITVNYDMQVNYKLHLPYPAYIKNPAYFAP